MIYAETKAWQAINSALVDHLQTSLMFTRTKFSLYPMWITNNTQWVIVLGRRRRRCFREFLIGIIQSLIEFIQFDALRSTDFWLWNQIEMQRRRCGRRIAIRTVDKSSQTSQIEIGFTMNGATHSKRSSGRNDHHFVSDTGDLLTYRDSFDWLNALKSHIPRRRSDRVEYYPELNGDQIRSEKCPLVVIARWWRLLTEHFQSFNLLQNMILRC